MINFKSKSGFTLIEVILSFVILMIVMSVVFPTIGWMIDWNRKLQNDNEAGLLIQEGTEAAYNVFLTQWADFPEGVYHPVVSVVSGLETWALLPGEQIGVEAKYQRKIEVAQVCRSVSTGLRSLGICSGDSTVDSNSKVIKTTISWNQAGQSHEVNSELLIANVGGS